ncbi:DUF389 domain-containing protein [Leekyejoonella antrihumi]|uniref:DUF389 domain-containing protein n=1 Tax=Leekyejoonella antrihumi TaxID=1660198 RepID=A0A563E4H3_9MICO|nr:DUF389 domain-containing protein [Leekyejoonella antrihumi]TWP37430.1 DUF389 domain-containing protein [Leekyejoonella antrihumi]
MLVHLRLTMPDHLTDNVLDLVRDSASITNLTLQRGACLRPAGDLIEVDVARESVSELLDQLDDVGLDKQGGIVLTEPAATPFDAAQAVEEAAEGDPDDSVIWDMLKQQALDGARPTVTFHLFLIIAVALASVAVITDSNVLVVGAMVVGPEFATIASICTGVVFLDRHLVLRAMRLLVLSFALAIVVIAVVALVARVTGLITPDVVTRPHPQTSFIWQPTTWSFVVALLAGSAGVLALTTEKAQAMVGVFISVTTVPAAGNMALALALDSGSELGGSAEQLGLNFVGMILAGTTTLLLQRFLVRRSHHAVRHLFGGVTG